MITHSAVVPETGRPSTQLQTEDVGHGEIGPYSTNLVYRGGYVSVEIVLLYIYQPFEVSFIRALNIYLSFTPGGN